MEVRRLEQLVAAVGATALVVGDHARTLTTIGDSAATVHCRSIRKSLLSALFGRHVLDGTIRLDATLADLGIDDSVPPSLSDAERTARVRDLLTCRSGVYHPSNHSGPQALTALPPRGSYRPGTHFLYNNWDFNALGTIFERSTRRSLFADFAETIAGPAQMQDFDLAEQRCVLRAPHLRFPRLHARPGPLRAALPERRLLGRARGHPGEVGGGEHRRARCDGPGTRRGGTSLRLPLVGGARWSPLRGHAGAGRVVRRLRHGWPVSAGSPRPRPRRRAAGGPGPTLRHGRSPPPPPTGRDRAPRHRRRGPTHLTCRGRSANTRRARSSVAPYSLSAIAHRPRVQQLPAHRLPPAAGPVVARKGEELEGVGNEAGGQDRRGGADEVQDLGEVRLR